MEKKWIKTAAAVCLTAVVSAGCAARALSAPTQSVETLPPTVPVTVPATVPTTVPATEPVLRGWQEVDGRRRFYNEKGEPLSGWLRILEDTYFLEQDGGAVTGWAVIQGETYFFDARGALCTGWLEREGNRYYLQENGVLLRGWAQVEGDLYCFGADGAAVTGWLERDGETYYLKPNGAAAVGPTEIEGRTHYFSPHGVHMMLVNPWVPLPEDYETELVRLRGYKFSPECAEALEQMLTDCRKAGCRPQLYSGYRTMESQKRLYNRKVRQFRDLGYGRAEAERRAAQIVAVPGTSEHQLGLAVDIIDSSNDKLNKSQARTKTQKWLAEHCWEYGFILRYPDGTTDITGIIYESWHYRYVGVEIALEIRDLGITLEEYLGFAPPVTES